MDQKYVEVSVKSIKFRVFIGIHGSKESRDSIQKCLTYRLLSIGDNFPRKAGSLSRE